MKDQFWEMMHAIWAEQEAHGHVPRTVEEVEAERRQIRDEWEERLERFARIHEEAQKARELAGERNHRVECLREILGGSYDEFA